MRIVAIHQPNLFPRLKILQKLALADVWIVLDNVQFEQREYQNRMLLVSNHGQNKAYWHTLPVSLPSGQATKIEDVLLTDKETNQKIEKAILLGFKANDEFKKIRETLINRIHLTRTDLVELGIASTTELLRIAGYQPEIIRASTYDIDVTSKSSRLVELCKKVNTSVYISDSGGSNYLEEDLFIQANINILWHVWQAPTGSGSQELGSNIRNCSGLNLLARSSSEFVEAVSNCFVSRQRHWSKDR